MEEDKMDNENSDRYETLVKYEIDHGSHTISEQDTIKSHRFTSLYQIDNEISSHEKKVMPDGFGKGGLRTIITVGRIK